MTSILKGQYFPDEDMKMYVWLRSSATLTKHNYQALRARGLMFFHEME